MSLIKKSSINISKLKRIEREKKMKLTKNFNINEFIYSKFYNPINQKRVVFDFYEDKELLYSVQKLASQLQVLRNYLNAPISINIAYRPKWYELLKGRSGNSQHTLGKAADIKAEGYTPNEVYNAIEMLIDRGEMLQGGLGSYSTFTHYDIGFNGRKRRW